MKKEVPSVQRFRSFSLSLIVFVMGSVFLGCFNPLQSKPSLKTFPVSVTWNGGGSAMTRGLANDPAVASVSILVSNAIGTLIGSGILANMQTYWGGKITMSETGLAAFEARAKNSSGVELYYGTRQQTLSGSGNDIVTIGVAPIPLYSCSPSDLGLYGADVSRLCSLGSTLFAGTSGGVFRSADNGSSWTKVETSPALFPTDSANYPIADMAVAGSKVFAITGAYLLTGHEDGGNWTAVFLWPNGLWSTDYSCIAVQGDWLYMGTGDAGVWFSPDGGATWADSSSGLPNGTVIDDIVIQGTKAFAACGGRDLRIDIGLHELDAMHHGTDRRCPTRLRRYDLGGGRQRKSL